MIYDTLEKKLGSFLDPNEEQEKSLTILEKKQKFEATMAKANPSFTHSEGKSFEIQASPCEMKNLGFSYLNTVNAFGNSINKVVSHDE